MKVLLDARNSIISSEIDSMGHLEVSGFFLLISTGTIWDLFVS